MKRILRLLSIALLLFTAAAATTIQAQTASPFGLSPIYNAADQVAFNAAYKASLPPALQSYMALPYNAFAAGSATAPARITPVILLQAANQYSLDTQIAVWGWDPYLTDLGRIVQGYAWVPSFGQPNIPVGPGLSTALVAPAGTPTYNPAAPPLGSIILPLVNQATGKMVLPLPYIAPGSTVAVSTASVDPVGFLEMPFGAPGGTGDWYSAITGDQSPIGTVINDSRGSFEKKPQGQANMITGTISVFWVKRAPVQ
jgi:hypothetical protein